MSPRPLPVLEPINVEALLARIGDLARRRVRPNRVRISRDVYEALEGWAREHLVRDPALEALPRHTAFGIPLEVDETAPERTAVAEWHGWLL